MKNIKAIKDIFSHFDTIHKCRLRQTDRQTDRQTESDGRTDRHRIKHKPHLKRSINWQKNGTF